MKTLTAFILTIILFTTVYSQEEKERNYALSFGIGENFTLRSFNMDFAVKKILDECHQIRLFLSPSVSKNNFENTVVNLHGTQKDNEDMVGYSLGIGIDYLWQLASKDGFAMYSGAGIDGRFGNSTKTETQATEIKTISETTFQNWGVGLRGILGVEWMVNDRIGIHAEYVASASYMWGKNENKYTSHEVPGTVNPTISTHTNNIFTLSSFVLFGLSVYL